MATLAGGVIVGCLEQYKSSTINKGKDGGVLPMGDGVPVPVLTPVTAGTVQFG